MKLFKDETKFIFISIIFLSFFVLEAEMIIRYGVPPFEQESSQFKYRYIDIYKKFFRKIRKGVNDVYIPQRFPNNSIEFSRVKDSNTIRIFIIGGSVAYYFGYFRFKNILEDLIRNKNFEVINCGMPAYDSYRDYLVEREILSYKPDLIIIFSGNNEFYNEFRINLWFYYLNRTLRKSWVYRKCQDKFLRWHKGHGLLYFRDKEKRFIDYERRMRLIAKESRKNKIPVIFCSLPTNFSDCPPLGKRPLDKHYLSACLLLDNEKYEESIYEFKIFLKSHPRDPFGFYFLGRAYEAIKDYQKSKESYLAALDLNFDGIRACPRSNEIIRKICKKEGAYIANLEDAFINISHHGLLGREQFLDNCHWYLEYNRIVAQTILKTIIRNTKMFSDVLVIDGNRLTEWDTIAHNFPLFEERNFRKTEIEHLIKYAIWKIYDFEEGISERAISYFQTLYLIKPNSLREIPFIKDKIKKLFLNNFWTKECTVNLDKHWSRVVFHIAETYRRLKLYQESLKYFDETIALDENDYLSYIGKALIYYTLGDKQRALNNINKAQRISDTLEVKNYKEILQF